ncbi:hypothetical protein D3C87_1769510 [compost metagenome]
MELPRRDRVIGGLAGDRAVIDQRREGGAIAAQGTIRIGRHRHLVEAGPQPVHQEQAPRQGRADAQDELQDLVGLQRPQDPGQGAEHPGLRAVRRSARRLGIQAAIAGASRFEDRELALEPVEARLHQRLAEQPARVV